MQMNRKVLRDLLNDLGLFDEEPIQCIDQANGRSSADIKGVVRETHDDADGSVSVVVSLTHHSLDVVDPAIGLINALDRLFVEQSQIVQ